MTTGRKPRGRPFGQGNAGRPVGSKNRSTQLMKLIGEDDTKEVLVTALRKAKGGDVGCMKIILERVCPARKCPPVALDLPPLQTSNDVIAAMASLWRAIAEGLVSPDEANALASVVQRSIDVMSQHELVQRIEALEEERALRNATTTGQTR